MINYYNITRSLRTSCIGQSRLYLALRYMLKRAGADMAIEKHLGKDVPAGRRAELHRLMRKAMIDYRWDFDEFFMFDYEGSTEEERREYVPEFDKNIFCDLINDPRQADIFLDKWTTYEHFREFFGRDIYNIRSLEDIERAEFTTYLKKHDRFMLKPVFGALGKGIEVLDSRDVEATKAHIVELYNQGVKAIILEELIDQDEAMAAIHPESVNTIRMRTVNVNGEVRFIYPSLRVGQGSAFVDNAGAGGILCNIDAETGVVYTACDKLGRRFDVHPDSGISLIGFKIPRWEEAKETVRKMTKVLPGVKYVGWDIALSKNGWVMVEGNDKGQWGFQYSNKRGFRTEMNAILRELGKKEI